MLSQDNIADQSRLAAFWKRVASENAPPAYVIHRTWRLGPEAAIAAPVPHDALASLSVLAGPDCYRDGPYIGDSTDLDWTRADCAFVRWMAECLARDMIVQGKHGRDFIRACKRRCGDSADDLIPEWISVRGVSDCELCDIFRAEIARMEAPSPLAAPLVARLWRAKNDTRSPKRRRLDKGIDLAAKRKRPRGAKDFVRFERGALA